MSNTSPITKQPIHTENNTLSVINPLDLCTRAALTPETPSKPFTSADLTTWQLNALTRVCAYAQKNSRHYKEKFKPYCKLPITSAHHFAKLPRTSQNALRGAPLDFLCTSQDDIARIVTLSTSGSTGNPKRLFFTQDELDDTVSFFHHGMRCIISAGDTALALLPASKPDSVGNLLANGLNELGATSILHENPDDVRTALELLCLHHPNCIIGTPAHVLALAKLWKKEKPPVRSIQSVLLCWDASSPAIRQQISTILNCHVHTHWGMTETGLGGAVSCKHGQGMHLRETDLYVEITDPDTGELLPDGERGEIVVTTLSRQGMPLIRYQTGDESYIIPQSCKCGSALRMLSPDICRLTSPSDAPSWYNELTPATLDGYLAPFAEIIAQQARYVKATNTLEVTIDSCGNSSLSSITAHLHSHISHLQCAPKISCLPGTTTGNISVGFAKRRIHID